MENQNEHFNVEAISKYISDKVDFVVVNVMYPKDDFRNKKEKVHFVSPVSLKDGKPDIVSGCVFDNMDVNGNVVCSKDEMIIKFSLLFGKTINYEMEQLFSYDGVESSGFRSI